ncbi:MAG: hypothetical protein IAG10_07045 [Planctomycetaceae bacterium]|nr:hypothetical protein [Planctomycetaceae bacterium]
MSVTIELPADLEATLRERLVRVPQNVTAFVLEAVREKLSRSKTLDEICAPFAQSVATSGVSDDELDRLFEGAREDVWQARQSQRS